MAFLETLGLKALTLVAARSADALATMREEANAHKVVINDSDARTQLIEHVAMIAKWASDIGLPISPRDKRLEQTFVELSLDLGLRRYASSSGRSSRSTIQVKQLFNGRQNAAILGRPGAGKTTTLKRVAPLALKEWEAGRGGVPVLVRLRDLQQDARLTSHLLTELGIRVRAKGSVSGTVAVSWQQRVLWRHLETISAILLVDGLDEVDPTFRDTIEDELEFLSRRTANCRVFLTCRTADYHRAIDGLHVYTIQSLSDSKVRTFASRWLGRSQAAAFVNAVRRNPYAGAEVVPLTLAHLCAIYERDGDLPPHPTEVYETIISLLIEQWDRQRGVNRRSQYHDFSWRKKERFLQAIAFHLTLAGRRGTFHHDDLANVYREIAVEFGLPTDDAGPVLAEIESHTGLVIASGYERYDFVHLVIQEFLAAMHAHRTPNVVRLLVPKCPAELAIVTAYSASAEEFLEAILEELDTLVPYDQPSWRARFSESYLARLAAEGPTFRPSVRLGWTLIAFADEVMSGQATTRPATLPGGVDALFRSPVARKALAMAIDDGSVFPHGNVATLVPAGFHNLAPHQRGRAERRKSAGFTLPMDGSNVGRLVARACR